jgi:hypothetical protein
MYDVTPEFPLNIEQGADYDNTFHAYIGGKFIAPIEFIEVGYPTVFTVTAHGLNSVSPTPVFVSGVVDLERVNSEDCGVESATRIDDNNFSMPVASVGEVWKVGSGEITYWKPPGSEWDGATATLNIRKNWHSSTVLVALTTGGGGLTLNGVDGSIRIQIAAAVTATYNFFNAVYDLDVTVGGITTRHFKGPVLLHRDI